MEYTEEQKRGFRESFAALRKRQLLATIPLVAVLVFLGFSDQETGASFGVPVVVWLPIAGLFVLGLVLFSLKNWRCPACRKYLGKGFGPKFCPKCGVALRSA